jgi:hypothetical protein
VDDNGNNEHTITNAKTIVQIEALAPEVPNRQLAAIVTSDLMILCKDPSMGKDPNSQLDLYAVLKMQTKRKPATLLQGSGIRLVDNKVRPSATKSFTADASSRPSYTSPLQAPRKQPTGFASSITNSILYDRRLDSLVGVSGDEMPSTQCCITCCNDTFGPHLGMTP